MNNHEPIVVVGGGPAGMMAAGAAAGAGARRVVLIERNAVPGKKLLLTGKGRCNVTNDCTRDAFFAALPQPSRFLYAAYSRFTAQDTQAFFSARGVPLKVERGGRVFPCSDRSADIVRAMRGFLAETGVEVRKDRVTGLQLSGGRVAGVVTQENGLLPAAAVILATGGLSYPATGSTGDGYRMARSCGHTIIPLRPSLVGLACSDPLCAAAAGLALKNCAVRLFADDREIYTDFGELLFTHTGLSGPVVLSASAHIREEGVKPYALSIDLKPALDADTLDRRLIRDFAERNRRDLVNALDGLLPAVLRAPFVARSGLSPDRKVHTLTRAERQSLVSLFKDLRFSDLRTEPMDGAVVTAGGVSTAEVDPKTMRSKLCGGLYFAGELLDLDAYTGGFNLQIAWATGAAAGRGAAAEINT